MEIELKKLLEKGEPVIKICYVIPNGTVRYLIMGYNEEIIDSLTKNPVAPFLKLEEMKTFDFFFKPNKNQMDVISELLDNTKYINSKDVHSINIIKSNTQEYKEIVSLINDFIKQISAIALPSEKKIIY